jgi:signal transduction histidine kinase
VSAVGLGCVVLAAACFVGGLAALRALRRRLELLARAEHELRGPATAMALACRRMRGDPDAAPYADVLEAQLERLRAGLEDLAIARRGTGPGTRSAAPVDLAQFVRAALEPWQAKLRCCSVDWRAGAAFGVMDRGRLAQTLGNLLANSAEHGDGDLRLRAVRVPGAVRLELRNGNGAAAGGGQKADRGRGLAIAAEAALELGGRLLVHRDEAATMAVLELPDGSAVGGPAAARAGNERSAGGPATARAGTEGRAGGDLAQEERRRHGDERPDSGLVA